MKKLTQVNKQKTDPPWACSAKWKGARVSLLQWRTAGLDRC